MIRHLNAVPRESRRTAIDLTPEEQEAADILAGEMALEAAIGGTDRHAGALLYAVARLTLANDREGLEGVDRILRGQDGSAA